MVFLACPKDCFDSCSIIAKSGQNVTIKGNPEHPVFYAISLNFL
ncbi:MAG: hypothetical protein QW283_00905 [Thermoplasmata archaeon]